MWWGFRKASSIPQVPQGYHIRRSPFSVQYVKIYKVQNCFTSTNDDSLMSHSWEQAATITAEATVLHSGSFNGYEVLLPEKNPEIHRFNLRFAAGLRRVMAYITAFFCSVCAWLTDVLIYTSAVLVAAWSTLLPPLRPGGECDVTGLMWVISGAITDCRQCMNNIAVYNIVQN